MVCLLGKLIRDLIEAKMSFSRILKVLFEEVCQGQKRILKDGGDGKRCYKIMSSTSMSGCEEPKGHLCKLAWSVTRNRNIHSKVWIERD